MFILLAVNKAKLMFTLQSEFCAVETCSHYELQEVACISIGD